MGKPRTRTVEALVLRSFDVGEADRFCLLFTREEGRLAARASGARKTGSRLGSALQPLCHARVDIAEHGAGTAVRSATALHFFPARTATELAVAQEAVELVLRLTDDGQDLPDVFEHCRRFFECPVPATAFPAFAVRLLFLLGILPLTEEDMRFAALSASARRQVRSCTTLPAPWQEEACGHEVQRFMTALLRDHLGSPLAATAVRAALTGDRHGRGAAEPLPVKGSVPPTW